MNSMATDNSFLSTRQGKLILGLVCLAAFLDVIDTTIVNIALPSIRQDIHFSVQNLQWIASGYLLTYGGFLLLGGARRRFFRPSPPLRRRHASFRRLVARLRARRQRGRADRCAPRPGARRGDDDPRGPLDPDHDLQ